jgi:hypothetical protein
MQCLRLSAETAIYSSIFPPRAEDVSIRDDHLVAAETAGRDIWTLKGRDIPR